MTQESEIVKDLRSQLPSISPQGWVNRRKRVSRTLTTASACLLAWVGGAVYAQAMNYSLVWPYFAVGLVPALILLYTLDLYIRGASREQKDFLSAMSELVSALGNATGNILHGEK